MVRAPVNVPGRVVDLYRKGLKPCSDLTNVREAICTDILNHWIGSDIAAALCYAWEDFAICR